MDTHSWVLWLGIIAVGLHVMEEYAEGWVVWANRQVGPRFGITFTRTDFLFAAFLLVFYALAGAAIGWWAPAVSLAVPALFVVNAVFLHMVPSARGDRLVPGTLSAVFVYLPVAAWMFWAAAEDDVLDFGTVVLAFVLGTVLMYYPLAVSVLAARIGWTEDDASAGDPAPAAGESAGDEPADEPGRQEENVEPEPGTETAVTEPAPGDDDTGVLDEADERPRPD